MVILVSCQHKYRYKFFPLLSFISAQFQNFVAFYSQYLLLARVGAVESCEIEIVIVFNHPLSRFTCHFKISITLDCSFKIT